MERPPLVRAQQDRLLAGVSAGLAAHLGVPVNGVRAALLLLTLFGGAGAMLYAWFWIMIPAEGETAATPRMRSALTAPERPAAPAGSGAAAAAPSAAGAAQPGAKAPARPGPIAPQAAALTAAPTAVPVPPPAQAGPRTADPAARSGGAANAPGFRAPDSAAAPGAGGAAGSTGERARASGKVPAAERQARRRFPIAELLLGTAFLVAGIGLVLTRFGVRIDLGIVLPGLAVLAGVGLAWWQIVDRERPDRNQIPRVLGALALVAVGVLMFFVTAREPSVWTVIVASLAVLAGVALALAPLLLRINRELVAERSARAREAERAEIAAHLHDSVLQTLALIQQRSEPGSEVARIARGQERELRDWLFMTADGGEAPPREAAAVELRTHAAQLEERHEVRFEVVSVGDGDRAEAPEPLIAAAREAMLNAARHAGGEVTVYVEGTPERFSIDVTDRGPGLDPENLPEDRGGVRESILGRMERAGGTARIVPGPGGGTSVRLGIARTPLSGGDHGQGPHGPAQPANPTTEGTQP
ncbi:ATP-binding protein [Leucobacter edaphi]|uniref:ATP-binding protein n=1 Tax=Leucobacter edaphi TaxID=2796472 RepID=UPI001F471D55|nr:ATP-binding protein [Leucobacter edaphi]